MSNSQSESSKTSGDAMKNLESEISKTKTLSAEDRRAINEGLLDPSVTKSLTDAGLESQRKRRDLQGGGPFFSNSDSIKKLFSDSPCSGRTATSRRYKNG